MTIAYLLPSGASDSVVLKEGLSMESCNDV